MTARGGKRDGAGRKPDPVIKSRIVINVPLRYRKEILSKFKKLSKAYEDKCKKEL